MITLRIRAAVSAVTMTVALAATLALGACARGPAPSTWDGTAEMPERLSIRFDNEAQTYVDVYLVGERREWWLGRVAAGALRTLRIPEEAPAASPGFVRLAVLADSRVTLNAASDPRATFTIAQPASALMSQRWTFTQRQLASPELFGTRLQGARP